MFAEWLDRTIQENHLSNAKVAGSLVLDRPVVHQTVAKWRRGEVTPSRRNLLALADFLGVDRRMVLDLAQLEGAPVPPVPRVGTEVDRLRLELADHEERIAALEASVETLLAGLSAIADVGEPVVTPDLPSGARDVVDLLGHLEEEVARRRARRQGAPGSAASPDDERPAAGR